MRQSENGIQFSATDLCNYMECAHLTSLSLQDLEQAIPKDERDEESELIAEKGMEFETQYLSRLKSGSEIHDLSIVRGSNAEKLQATVAGLAKAPEILYQAYLEHSVFMGYADFLLRVDTPSRLGAYSYEVLDTKLSRTPKPYFIIQLCLYSELLEALQGLRPAQMHVALGDGRTVSYQLRDYWHYYQQLKSEFLRHVQEQPDTYPDACSHCDRCHFHTFCSERRLSDDHLSQVANIRRNQITRLTGVGISTMEELARSGLAHIKGIGDETLARLKRQASLQLHKKTTGEDKYVVLPEATADKGISKLPPPDTGDLYFDIEGDPLYPDGLEYLFGVYFVEGKQDKFVDLWSHDHAAEKVAFEKLISFFMERLKKYPGMHIYHYAPYEQTAIKRLMCRYGTMEAEVDHLLRQNVFVDLYQVVRHSIQVSEPSYSIKNLERFYMEGRDAEVKDAGASIVYYEKFVKTQDKKYLDDILAYNCEDCRSLLLLRDWLLSLKTANTPQIVAGEPEPYAPKEDAHLVTLMEFERTLGTGLPEDPAEFTAKNRLDKLVLDLADFYRREAKPAWWRMFSRQDMTTEELIEDSECLGGLTRDTTHPPEIVKQSHVYTYSFPEQEHKFKVGDKPLFAATSTYAGEIVAIDDEAQTVQLKRGIASGELPDHLDICPTGPIKTDELRDALWAFVRDYIDSRDEDSNPHRAIVDLLSRKQPRVKGVKPGDSLVREQPVNLAGIQDVVSNLDDSYLFIQGPPGTGKTYTASHLILDLMARGKRIGVTANSHKVVHNLLDAIERRAEESNSSFVGIKKSSGQNAESIYESAHIQSVGTAAAVADRLAETSLVAGTAWLFAQLGPDKPLDYLFIDEAGQFSLAYFISAGISARNIVLIGDQMQLAQPTQGVHPGDSGLSVLDYLLRGRHTIPTDEGILLQTTYRMHPDLCSFISDAIYDGRITSAPGLERQEIRQNGASVQGVPGAGLACHFVRSENSVQRSDEEAVYIADLYSQLLGMKYADRSGAEHALQQDNVLIVSPYNMQVNNLKRTLGDRARVGTVDKFQGQEAEIVLVSMATSSPEDVPRGIDFLYSQNRLNVALSRARAVSILVMSPSLLSVRCNTIEQMRLVNTLCWAKNDSLSLQISSEGFH